VTDTVGTPSEAREPAIVELHPVVEMRGIEKAFVGTQAVNGVDFAVNHREIMGLVGKNGAGKSTLIKILAGLVQRDAGEVFVQGRLVEIHTAHAAQKLGIAFLHQDLNDVPSQSVTENLWLGYRLPRRWGIGIDWRAAKKHTREALALVGAAVSPNDRVASLSIAQRQLVMLARAVSQGARLVVLDEPTSSLSEYEVMHLRDVVRRLRDEGTSVVFISHRLAEVLEFCDRVTVMRDGVIVDVLPTHSLERPELVRLITGEIGGSADGRRRPDATPAPGADVLRVEHLSRRPAVHDVSFAIRQGEVLGVAGLVGSGRTEVAELLFGVTSRDSGRVVLHDREVNPTSPRDAALSGISLLPEDRRQQGLVPSFGVRENMTLPTLEKYRITRALPLPSRRKETRLVREMIQSLSIVTSGTEDPIVHLSGGNQQKVVLAKWLLNDTDVFIFDEPTHGVDVEAKEEIYAAIERLALRGRSVIFISSDFEEIVRVAHRVVVMREGKIVAELSGDEISEDTIIASCYVEDDARPN
jgi:ABC-type sugar transport system ATPase subunit